MSAKQAPLKWRKYLKLVEHGLLTEQDLQKDIKRYSINEIDQFLIDIRQQLEGDECREQTFLYVVKLVYPYLYGQLPNLRITNKTDLGNLPQFLKSRSINCTEIWYCRTLIDHSIMSVAGRISFCFGKEMVRHIVEQVWRCSPRLIESLSNNFPYPYIRASRWSWGWRYEVEHCHIPAGATLSTQQIRREFFQCMVYLEQKRDLIYSLLEEVEQAGLGSVSLEYKVIGSNLSVIDWDTSDDSKIFDR